MLRRRQWGRSVVETWTPGDLDLVGCWQREQGKGDVLGYAKCMDDRCTRLGNGGLSNRHKEGGIEVQVCRSFVSSVVLGQRA